MKNVVVIFDVVLLILVLGIMLPFLFGTVKPLTDMENWGFVTKDDKTMKLYGGDVFTEIAQKDKVTVPELLLMIETGGSNSVQYNGFLLLNDNNNPIIFDSNYLKNKDGYLDFAKSLNKSLNYTIEFDYKTAFWRVSLLS